MIAIEDGVLRIEDLEVDDGDVVDYLQTIPEEDRENEIQKALRVGVIALRSSKVSIDVDFVDKKIAELLDDYKTQVDEQVDELFGDEGRVWNAINEIIGDEGALAKLFDPHEGSVRKQLVEAVREQLSTEDEGAPLSRVRSSILDELRAFKELYNKDQGRGEEAEKGTAKGRDFEDTIQAELDAISANHGDVTELCGDVQGTIAGSKKGDLLTKVSAAGGGNIVWEIKKHGGYTIGGKKDILVELTEAMKNRDAGVGVAVFSKDQGPKGVEILRRLPDNQYIVIVDEDDPTSLEVLRVVYQVCREIALRASGAGAAHLDIDELNGRLNAIESLFGKVKGMKGSISKIQTGLNNLSGDIDSLRNDVMVEVAAIQAMISVAGEE